MICGMPRCSPASKPRSRATTSKRRVTAPFTTTAVTPMNSTANRFAPLRRPLAWVGAGALIVAGFGLLFRPAIAQAEKPATPVAPPATKVTVAPVEEKLVTEFEEITGRIDAIETVELRARVSGHLESVHFQAGQLVKKGDVLFTIDPRWYQAQFDLATARAEVAEAEAHRARAAEARADLATARLDLEHTEVRAPIDGRVSRAFVTGGNLVSGSPG